ncbi:unnamed protein product [Cuscuta campestris]|uniref:Retrotransposon Copia-like N-terminal domain-containing protein n=1 Tax=Cuscuta campestris TaxID=132261 RepID=A0A484MFY9_9ASTE|nr:unnamed protein product [Cuscuta campestris]
MAKAIDPLDALPTGLKLFIKNLHSLSPEKLDDTNFPSWIATTSANLSAHRLLGYVDGTITAPPKTLDVAGSTDINPEFEVWPVINAQLCACLLAIISPSVQNHLHGLDTAAAIWEHLQLRYNSLSRTHIFQLKEQLHNVQKGPDSMQKYLDSVVKIVAALDRAKAAVPEHDVILGVLRGLLAEYASIKQNIRTNMENVTFAQVSSWLLAEELNLQMEQKLQPSDSPATTDPHTALYAQSGGRGRGQFSGPPSPSPQAFYASQSTGSNGNWFLDTGANTHVTPDLSRLYSYRPYSGTDSVTSAGGHPLPIAHVGSDPGQQNPHGEIQRPL